MVEFTFVKGRKNDRKVTLYALSTCVWCKKTKRLLDSLDLCYEYIFVDLLDKAERDEIDRKISKMNPGMSFPTIVIDDSIVIIGFDEDRLRQELEK